MDLESINKLLEEGAQSESPSHSLSTFYYIFIFFLTHDLSIFPSKNGGNSLHGGATATLVALVGAAAILSAGHSSDSGVSVEINVSYFGAVYAHEEIEIDARVLRVGKAVAVVSVEFRKKKTGKVFAQWRHTKYLPITSKI
ncbi:hypothetical protein AAZX31_04G186700 [Glycine max]|uniref:Acyl-coenzyme A thioesterase 13 n=1 Tax=Glycine max TaxID=3847 RepID=K7KLB0_SOYBN|nr:putative esterase F42H10.6 [Glycine max]KAG5050069.1 hypothetical protein JHK85_011172 [Glycine max]KAH1112352.1 hypothetical protein GYH30_010570 [Glycine max]KAH1255259.1 Acyl-coenzyme A thioesterase 13 [Glycine max]KRH63916.1 hypothetical protein GLYMA_04G204200v4 [Glycine max]|eukprot:XP_025984061.1 putative esterase F42H10.6 [Glycine max]